MTRLLPFFAILFSWAACVAVSQPATSEAAPATPPGVGVKVSFRPSVAIVVGIFTMIFALTFLLLMYAKFCHRSPSSVTTAPADHLAIGAAQAGGNDAGQETGVAKTVIESLPFFRFAALRGARQGLECAVCLARFDDADLLRLLPRCRHAFHLDCVDRWLESNASCPLCRARVDAEDAALGLKYAASARFLFDGSDRFDNSGRIPDPAPAPAPAPGRDLLDLFVERVPSSRFKEQRNRGAEDPGPQFLDRHKHRIVVSDVVFKSRWSDLNSADLIALDTEILRTMSSRRFPSPDSEPDKTERKRDDEDSVVILTIKEEMEKKRLLESKVSVIGGSSSRAEGGADAAAATARMISAGARSMSEIVNLPRLRAAMRDRLTEEEKARRLWLPIARRTARWFAGRERRYVKGETAIAAPDRGGEDGNDAATQV